MVRVDQLAKKEDLEEDDTKDLTDNFLTSVFEAWLSGIWAMFLVVPRITKHRTAYATIYILYHAFKIATRRMASKAPFRFYCCRTLGSHSSWAGKDAKNEAGSPNSQSQPWRSNSTRMTYLEHTSEKIVLMDPRAPMQFLVLEFVMVFGFRVQGQNILRPKTTCAGGQLLRATHASRVPQSCHVCRQVSGFQWFRAQGVVSPPAKKGIIAMIYGDLNHSYHSPLVVTISGWGF